MADDVHSNETSGPVMPASPQESASVVQNSAGSAPVALPPPPSFGRQVAQLIIIPAVIALVAIALFWLFGSMAATPDSMKDQLARLKQTSGYGGNLIGGAQDPRYKDRCQAAFQIASMIGKMNEDARQRPMSAEELAEHNAKRKSLSQELVTILKDRVHPDDQELTRFMLLAIGQLAMPEAFEVVLSRADSPHWQIRAGVAGAILSWTDLDPATARGALPTLVKLVDEQIAEIRVYAAGAIWKIATPQDTDLIPPLRQAMSAIGRDQQGLHYQTSVNYAAMALAALGDPQGSQYVADKLLDRTGLAQLRPDSAGESDDPLTRNEQDRMLAATLFFVSKMPDERVWSKVKALAENDPSVSIRKAAIQLLEARGKGPEKE